MGTDVLFVLPRPVATPFSTHVRLVSPQPGSTMEMASTEFRMDEFQNVTFRTVDAQLTSPYLTPKSYKLAANGDGKMAITAAATPPASVNAPSQPAAQGAEAEAKPEAQNISYANDLFGEVQRYAALAAEVASTELFDVVHAHDWMTFPAGLAVAGARGVPLVVHVHSTEFDRSGNNIDTRIFDIERRGMQGAIRVIAVSHLTKSMICERYGIDEHKIDVVYNAVGNGGNGSYDAEKYNIHRDEKIVLFLGRITMQKGPDYFLAAAKKVLEVMDNVKFVMAGSGDLMRQTIEMASAMGIGDKVLFTGFLNQADVERVFKLADLYVMPSVSEPFGIAPLEAMSNDVPVIISKQSGVSEVLQHVLKVDFWDIDEMANKIVAVLKHPPLSNMLREHGAFEVKKLSWGDAAKRCVEVYGSAIDTMRLATMPTAI